MKLRGLIGSMVTAVAALASRMFGKGREDAMAPTCAYIPHVPGSSPLSPNGRDFWAIMHARRNNQRGKNQKRLRGNRK